MIDFDYDALAALAEVAREGSFEAAARALNVTQSAVSQRIKQLEERLGAILIVRGRPCVPTEYGLQLCRHVDHVLLLEHELKRLIGSTVPNRDAHAAVLRVVVNTDSLSTWFPAVVYRALEEINVHLEIMTDDQEHSASRLKSGEALAALTSNAEPIQGFRMVPLGAMQYMSVASPSYIEKYLGQGVTADALKAAPSIVFDRKDLLPHQWLEEAFGEAHILHGSMIPSYEGYLACLLNGTGWGMMPTGTVQPYIDAGELVELVPDRRVHTSLYWQSSARGTEVFRLLSEIVTSEADKRLIPQTLAVTD